MVLRALYASTVVMPECFQQEEEIVLCSYTQTHVHTYQHKHIYFFKDIHLSLKGHSHAQCRQTLCSFTLTIFNHPHFTFVASSLPHSHTFCSLHPLTSRIESTPPLSQVPTLTSPTRPHTVGSSPGSLPACQHQPLLTLPRGESKAGYDAYVESRIQTIKHLNPK